MSEKEQSPEYKNMMTCGHMSLDDKCPFECPDSKVLYNVREDQSTVSKTVEGIGSESDSANG